MICLRETFLRFGFWIACLFCSSHGADNGTSSLGGIALAGVTSRPLVLGCKCVPGGSAYWKHGKKEKEEEEEDVYDGVKVARDKNQTLGVLTKSDECRRDLVIRNATPEMAGVYRCRTRSDPTFDVVYQVVAIERNFSCHLNQPHLKESHFVIFDEETQIRVNCSFLFRADDSCSLTSTWFIGGNDSINQSIKDSGRVVDVVGGPFEVVSGKFQVSWNQFSPMISNFSNGSMLSCTLSIECTYERIMTKELKHCYLSPPIYISAPKIKAAFDEDKPKDSTTFTSTALYVGIPVLISMFTLAISCATLILIVRFYKSSEKHKIKSDPNGQGQKECRVNATSEYPNVSPIGTGDQYHRAAAPATPAYIEILNDDRTNPPPHHRLPLPAQPTRAHQWRLESSGESCSERDDGYEKLEEQGMLPNAYSRIVEHKSSHVSPSV